LVLMNYRLGPFGYLASQELISEANGASVGNYGLLDQRLALQWVQKYISYFGGNPNQVTIYGESAGALSVFWHLLLPNSAGLFQNIICESGTLMNPIPLNQALTQGITLANNVAGILSEPSCNLACLRNAPMNAILSAIPTDPILFFTIGNQWAPVIDGVEITQTGLAYIQNQQYNPVDNIILGTNLLEGGLFTAETLGGTVTQQQINDFIELSLNPSAGALAGSIFSVASFTPSYGPEAGFIAMSELITDLYFTCPTYIALSYLSAKKNVKGNIYSYLFAESPACTPQLPFPYHTAELAFVFNQETNQYGCQMPLAEVELAEVMSTSWLNFVATGNPSVVVPELGLNFVWDTWNPTNSTDAVFATTVVGGVSVGGGVSENPFSLTGPLNTICFGLLSANAFNTPTNTYSPVTVSTPSVISNVVNADTCFAYDSTLGAVAGYSVFTPSQYLCCTSQGIQQNGKCISTTCGSSSSVSSFTYSTTAGAVNNQACYYNCYLLSPNPVDPITPEGISLISVTGSAPSSGLDILYSTSASSYPNVLLTTTSGLSVAYEVVTGEFSFTTFQSTDVSFACKNIGQLTFFGCAYTNSCGKTTTVQSGYFVSIDGLTCFVNCYEYEPTK